MVRYKYLLKLNLVLCAIILSALRAAQAESPQCVAGKTVSIGGGKSGIEIDDAWSGTTVIFDAISRNGKTYIGYYNAERWLTVAQLDNASGIVCRSRLDSRYAGWDSHNSIVLAFDKIGHLQIAGNMHATPLVYGEANTPDSISHIVLSPMIGKNEENVTYPNFITSQDGNLYFAYRSGVSGDGEWFVNVLKGGQWKRTLDVPILAASWGGAATNGYPSPLQVSSDGYVHIAVVWRRSPDVASNYALTYARTSDFARWEDNKGKTIIPPLSPGNGDIIDFTGEGAGLLNLTRVGVSPSGKPIVAYSKYGPGGRNVIILASPTQKGWDHAIIATAENRTSYEGKGTIPNFPALGQLRFDDEGRLGQISVGFPGENSKIVFFDTETLNPTKERPKLRTSASNSQNNNITPPTGLIDVRKTSISVRAYGRPDENSGSIVYFSQDKNRDRPRICSPSQPMACNPPPSPLIFVPNS